MTPTKPKQNLSLKNDMPILQTPEENSYVMKLTTMPIAETAEENISKKKIQAHGKARINSHSEG